jgi:putative intracellular protease/amidase
LENKGVRVIVLSASGKEAIGMKKDKLQPDGMIVDWNRQSGIQGKYNVVIVVGGKGAKKSLWDDPIVPQILTDHYRSGRIIGAIGSGLVVLVRASLVTGEIPLPKDSDSLKELEALNAVCVDLPVTRINNIILGQDVDSVDNFSEQILLLMNSEEC